MTPKEFLLHALDNVNNGRIIGHGLLYGDEPSTAAGLQHIDFLSLQHYSITPKTHVVNGFTVPAPVKSVDQCTYGEYYFSDHTREEGYDYFITISPSVEMLCLNNNLFATKEAAIANQKAQAFIDPIN